jgi:hypothetical protein
MESPVPRNPPAKHDMHQLNHMLEVYGDAVRTFFREQQRSSMVAPLFNLPGRMLLGAYCYYENLPQLLSWLLQYETPEAIGERMRRVGVRPDAISINSLMLGYLNGREQARLTGTAHVDNVEKLALVLDFWARTSSSYRSDGQWLPDQADFTMPILSQHEVARLERLLRPVRSEAWTHKVRRMMAVLELFTFVQNGEARIGLFHHGPYPLDGGDVLVVKQLVGLRQSYYSWIDAQTEMPFFSVARVMRLRGVHIKIGMMGSMITEPRSYDEHVVAEAVLLCDASEGQELEEDTILSLTERGAEAQMTLYRAMAKWEERQRTAYGAELYGCILHSFAPLDRKEEFARRIRATFDETVTRHCDSLRTGATPPVVLDHIARTDGPIYAPIH